MKVIQIGVSFLLLVISIHTLHKCNNIPKPFLRYYKIRPCSKSTLPIIYASYVSQIGDCMKIARERNGVAFNFSPDDARNLTKTYINCQVLGCPEVGDAMTLVSDVGFDYYSAFGDLNATSGSFCIKSIGLFKLNTEKQNYTESVKYCSSIGADLANILTEVRTNSLADVVKNSVSDFYKAAYVGLDDVKDEGVFETPLGELLQCTRYRAWAPGHPRPNRTKDDCVILDASRVWRAINCKYNLSSICEFYPHAPVPEDGWMNTTNEGCETVTDLAENKLCRQDWDLYELYLNSSRIDKCVLLEGL